ncbi:MAG: hypothetical protein KC636_37135 [Myxococcales bacterium]|nr:hypothetical protein [Myxococcales bacterium]
MRLRSFASLGLLLAIIAVGCDGGGDTATDASSTDASSTTTDGGSSGTDTTAGPTEGEAIDYDRDIQPIWEQTCSCHFLLMNGTMIADDLNLDAPSMANLVDVPAAQLPTMSLVTPGDPDNSYLWLKLQDTYLEAGGSGDPMPQVGFPLDDADLDKIEQWILGL